MKLTVVLEKKSRFNIELTESEAKNMYRKMVNVIVDSLNIHSAKVINKLKLNEEYEEIDKTEGSKREVNASEEVISEVKEPRTINYKRLIIAKCPSCGEIATPVVNVKDGELMDKSRPLICKHCQGELPAGKLKQAKYQCPNCNAEAAFYTINDLKEVQCKDCGSLIDLVWHEKKERYLSANLIK